MSGGRGFVLDSCFLPWYIIFSEIVAGQAGQGGYCRAGQMKSRCRGSRVGFGDTLWPEPMTEGMEMETARYWQRMRSGWPSSRARDCQPALSSRLREAIHFPGWFLYRGSVRCCPTNAATSRSKSASRTLGPARLLWTAWTKPNF